MVIARMRSTPLMWCERIRVDLSSALRIRTSVDTTSRIYFRAGQRYSSFVHKPSPKVRGTFEQSVPLLLARTLTNILHRLWHGGIVVGQVEPECRSFAFSPDFVSREPTACQSFPLRLVRTEPSGSFTMPSLQSNGLLPV